MAKKRAGLTPSALSRRSLKTVRAEAARDFKRANQRIKALKEAGLFEISPAIADLGEQAKFSSRGLNKEELIVEIVRARQFMREKTSQVRYARQFQLQMEYRDGDYTYYEKSQMLSAKQWKTIHSAVEDLNQEQSGIYRDPSEMIVFMVNEIFRQDDRKVNKRQLKNATREYVKNVYRKPILTTPGNR